MYRVIRKLVRIPRDFHLSPSGKDSADSFARWVAFDLATLCSRKIVFFSKNFQYFAASPSLYKNLPN